MRLLVTRPEPDASRQAERLAARGHVAVLAPLLTIETIEDVPLDLDGAQALIVTSRNALRALAARRDLPEAVGLRLFAVGPATAEDAMALGFADIDTGAGTGEALADLIAASLGPSAGALVHLAGETVAFDLKSALEAQGFTVRQPMLYRSAPARVLPPGVLKQFAAGTLDGVILMSPRTAATFVELVRRHGLAMQASRLVCYCLSGAVARAAEPLSTRLMVAAAPREEDILALISAQVSSWREAGHSD